MTVQRVLIFLVLGVVLGVPWLMRPATQAGVKLPASQTLVVLSPHVPQIQREFQRAFDAWHRREHGSAVRIDWRQPGGTSEIMKVLEAHFQSAVKAGVFDLSDPKNPVCAPGGTAYDLMLGGGSYEFGRLKRGVRVTGVSVPGGGTEVTVPLSVPAGFSKAQLDAWYGENRVGAAQLYDPEQYWLGTALSGFGIVYNREVLARLGVPEPTSFEDLTDPRLRGWLALADPRQSGSVTTTYDSILSNYGWERGWRMLRELSGNSRYFANSSPKPPIDVSHGEAAAGLAIDFYGRGQGQAVMLPGEDPATSRVGYVDPKGATFIDADPVAILRGGPNPELSKRFVEFCLSEEGQALWQFPALAPGGVVSERAAANPKGPGGGPMGPQDYALRRMPVRRVMYEKYQSVFVDPVEPFLAASQTKPAGWRSGIPILMGAFGIDNADQCRGAWRALLGLRGKAGYEEAERVFYSFPKTRMPDGAELEFTPENFRAISGLWNDPGARARCEVEYTAYFRRAYGEVVRIATAGAPGSR